MCSVEKRRAPTIVSAIFFVAISMVCVAGNASAGVLDKGGCPEESASPTAQHVAGNKQKEDCPTNLKVQICDEKGRKKLSVPLQLKLKASRAIDRHQVNIKLTDGSDGAAIIAELKLKKAKAIGKTVVAGKLKKKEICRAAADERVLAIELSTGKNLK